MFQFLKEVPSASAYCFPGLCSSSVSWVVGGGGGGVRGYYRAIGLQGRGIYYIWQTGGRSTGFPFSPPPFCLPPTPLPFDGYKIRHACHQHTADTSIYGLLV